MSLMDGIVGNDPQPDPRFPHAPAQWSPEEATRAAGDEGLELGEDHLEALRALQEYYARRPEHAVNLRELHDALDEKFHGQGGIKYLYQLFPGGKCYELVALQSIHGNTLANLTLRLLFKDLGFSNDEVAFYDVGIGFVALLIGIFLGGILYVRLGMKRAVLISLILMAVSNLSFGLLAAAGHTNIGMAAAVGFENFASGIGGVTVVAYLSALCNLRFTATQYALLSALASIAGRFLTGTTVGALIDAIGYVNFYLLTTLVALPGVILFWFMIRSGLADQSIGSAGKEGAR